MCGAHELYWCTGSAPGFVQRITSNSDKIVQKVVAGKASGNHTLWVKLTKMFNVPGVAHRNAIFGLNADSAGPSDSFHPIRAFPQFSSASYHAPAQIHLCRDQSLSAKPPACRWMHLPWLLAHHLPPSPPLTQH